MQEYFRGWYKERLTAVPRPRPNPVEENDLYHSIIPPLPAFLKAMSSLTIKRQRMTISERTNDIGNGKTNGNKTTTAKAIKNQSEEYFSPGIPLSLALLITWFLANIIFNG
jgi:hypothetical protein